MMSSQQARQTTFKGWAMTFREILLAGATASAVIAAAPAAAELYITGSDAGRVEQASAAQAQQRWQDKGGVVVRATGTGRLADYTGLGEAVALDEAMDLILPPGWVTRYGEDVEREMPVSWDSESGVWVDALYEMLRDTNYAATVAIDDERVHITHRDQLDDSAAHRDPAVSGTNEQDARGTETATASGSDSAAENDSDTAGSVTGDYGQPDAVVTLNLSQGESLRSELEAFTESHGWQFHWDVETDYTVGFDASTRGPFIEVVERLMSAINNRGGESFTAKTYNNNVLRITNR